MTGQLALHCVQALVESPHTAREQVRRFAAEKPDHWNRLLRSRHQRPCRRRAAEERDQISPPHDQPSRQAALYHIVT
jgi:hypothetical protein